MDKYGLTENGPNIKRLDTIIDEMHEDLTEKWGVNTKQNTQSVINHLITNIADKIAELWELGESLYYSTYPSSAEGISLDNAAQFGGTTRQNAVKSFYPIHCKATEGTTLESGITISSNTNPVTYLSLSNEVTVSRTSFNEAVIKIAATEIGGSYTVYLNDEFYSYTSQTGDDELKIVQGLKSKIDTGENFTAMVDETNAMLVIASNDVTVNNSLVLSENLTTENITTILTFGTLETGDIYLPKGTINTIVKAPAGLLAVENKCSYIAGRDEETDVEFRQSYADKIFNRSSMMLESIKSAILQNVQGVTSVAPYENASDVTDEMGRPPHSIEIVVEGGDATEIAQQILNNKSGGISTYGKTEVTLTGVNGEDIVIRFNEPDKLYVWFKVVATVKNTNELPSNYAEILKTSIITNINKLNAGDDIVPQEFISELYKSCGGIAYLDISLATSETPDDKPETYNLRSVVTTERQRVQLTEGMIDIELDD